MKPLFEKNKLTVIGALHLPPMLGSQHPAAQPISKILDICLSNAEKAIHAGIPALYIQDLGDFPWAQAAQPYSIAGLSVVGAAIKREFPHLHVGVCMMAHAAKEPIAIAQAIGASFVRIKVYSGSVVKTEGIVQGCAWDAIQYRAQIHACDVQIFADVYDRTCQPLGRWPIVEEARNAAVFGRADGLVLTGLDFSESAQMISDVRCGEFGIPLLLGGGANVENIPQIAGIADGVIVSSAFKSTNGWTREAMLAEWEVARIDAFMEAVQNLRG